MIALFDSGNQRLHFGLWEDGHLIRVEHVTYPDYPKGLRTLVSILLKDTMVDGAAAASVSSRWREPLFQAINALIPGKLRMARTAGDAGIRVPYEKSETYGVDRALAAKAAFHRSNAACVVVNAGTALTVDAVKEDGSVAGGFIMPGFSSQASSLAARTDLPLVSPEGKKKPELGRRSTEECIRLGILCGFRAAAEDLAKRAVREVHAGDRVFLTGGESELLSTPFFKKKAVVIPGLVLEGLGLAWERLPGL